MRRLLYAGILSVFIIGGALMYTAASAQQPAANEPIEVSTDIFVNAVSVGSAAAGASVPVSFDIANAGTAVRSDVRYRLELVVLNRADALGIFEPSEAIALSALSESITLVSGLTRVTTEYQLPDELPEGVLGLLVQVYEQGMTPTAYEFTELSVTGPRVTYLPQSALIVVNDTEGYELLEGPTVATTESVLVDVEVYNTLSDAQTFIPTVQLFSGTHQDGELVAEIPLPQVTIPAGDTLYADYALPIETVAPGVYTAVVTFEPVASTARITPIEARIVIDGLQPKIKTVTYEDVNLTATDDTLSVRVEYTDVPINLRRAADGTFTDARTAALFATSTSASTVGDATSALLPNGIETVVRVTDAQRGTLLGEQRASFTNRSPVTTLSFDHVRNVTQLLVTVTLLRDGTVIDTFTDTVSVTTRQQYSWIRALLDKYPLQVIGGTVLIVLALIVGAISNTVRKRKQL